jgi:hypothetical protein
MAPPTTRKLNSIDVDQTTPQSVRLNWDNGTSESAICSTGKGHCCLDETAAEGAAATAAGTRADKSNLTPVGSYRITLKLPVTQGGVRLWSQFVDARSIALHEYSPVDGTPLSHGCVRLRRETAQKIFDGSEIGRTKVNVRGLPAPRVTNPTLVKEWASDFQRAGDKPPDGDKIDPFLGRRPTRGEIARERRSIQIERAALRSALGVDEAGLTSVVEELDKATAGFASGTAAQRETTMEAVAKRIPRCVPTQTTEERRIDAAARAGAAGTQGARLRALEKALGRTAGLTGARAVVRKAGRGLWDWAISQAEQGGQGTDDRLLYWTRLEFARVIRTFEPTWLRPPQMNPDQARRARGSLLQTLERSSRGQETAEFSDRSSAVRRIVVVGFDPFSFGQGISRGNPSGAAALDLDNELLKTSSGIEGRVQAAVFPVRYADFNEGIVERHLGPYLNGSRPADMIITISMGAGADFELEEFAGRRRSVESGAIENLGVAGGGTETSPVEAPGLGAGPEFIRTNVPAPTLAAMRRTVGRTTATMGETAVREIRPKATSVTRSPKGPTAGSTAVAGSGGGFLSNEIFYRTRRLQSATQAGQERTTLVVHIHTPHVDAPDPTDRAPYDQRRNEIVRRVREMIEAALGTL